MTKRTSFGAFGCFASSFYSLVLLSLLSLIKSNYKALEVGTRRKFLELHLILPDGVTTGNSHSVFSLITSNTFYRVKGVAKIEFCEKLDKVEVLERDSLVYTLPRNDQGVKIWTIDCRTGTRFLVTKGAY